MDFAYLIFGDAVVVLVMAFLVLRQRNASLSHPAVIYLIFHVGVFSVRLWALAGGAERTLQLTDEEIRFAVVLADSLLVAFTFGTLMARNRYKEGRLVSVPVNRSAVLAVSLLCFPAGMYSLLTRAYVPGRVNETAISTSYQIFAISWPGLIVVALIYCYGFRWYLVALFVVYLGLMSIQGYGRFRVVIPALLVVLIGLELRRRKWPSVRLGAALVLFVIVFIPLKNIGVAVQQNGLAGADLGELLSDSTSSVFKGENTEQSIFDQYAVSLTLSKSHEPGMGRHYLDLLSLPVPRTLWPDKPGTAEHVREISTTARPLHSIGAVIMLPGELYYDFRWVGVLVGGLLGGYVFTVLHARAGRAGFGTVVHFMYLLFAASLIQVYRDGLVSVPVFLLVNSTPLFAIGVLSIIFRPRVLTDDAQWHLPERPRLAAGRSND